MRSPVLFLFGARLLSCAFILLSPGVASAYTDWRDIGPGCAVTVQVSCHPTDPDVVYFVADTGHVFRSKDRGRSYHRISHRIALATQPHRQFRSGEHCLAVDPRGDHSETVYYSPGQVGAGLWKSTRLGDPDSWEKVGPDHLGQSVVAVNHRGEVICLNSERKILVSRDGGATWTTTHRRFPFHLNAKSWLSPLNYKVDLEISRDNTLWVCDRKEGNGLFCSQDNGRTWKNALPGTWLVDVACSPSKPGLIVALAQDGGIFRSADGGATWSSTGKVKHGYWNWNVWPFHPGGVAINGKGRVIAIGRYEMGISHDEGRTFTVRGEAEIPWSPGDYVYPKRQEMVLKCAKVTASPAIDGLWFFGCGQVVKRSVDNGRTWAGAVKGLHGLWMYGMPWYDSENPDVFHVANVDCGHAYTTDLGKTWTYTEGQPWTCEGVTQDPNDPKIYYKAMGYGTISIYRSTDRGRTYRRISNIKMASGEYGGRLFVDPTDSNTIYFTMRGGAGVYRSQNAGRAFELVFKMPGIHHSMITRRGNVYFHTWSGRGLYRYLKRENRWQDIAPDMDVDGFAVHPENEDIVFLNTGSFPGGGKGTLLRTSNALSRRRDWQQVGRHGGMALYIDPWKPQYMLMMTNQENVGMMYSSDSGRNWKSIHHNHGTSFVWGFQSGGPAAKGRVYTFDAVACYIENLYNPEYEGSD